MKSISSEETYIMFTSRAEYRTLLRHDNANLRLTKIAYGLGLASKERYDLVCIKVLIIKFLKGLSVTMDEINPILKNKNLSPIKQSMKLYKIISKPQSKFEEFFCIEKLSEFIKNNKIQKDVIEQIEIQLKYAGNIEKANADKLNRLENVKIPSYINMKK